MMLSAGTTTMSKLSADRDSLVALDALLRIGGSRSPKKDDTKQIQTIEKAPESPSKSNVSSKVRGNAGMLLPQMDNSSAAHQLAAIQAAGVAASLSNSFGAANFSVHAAAAHLLNRQAEQIHAAVAEQNEIENSRKADAVRKEKVEAALRSKPQRGRKREDLSEKERLELTRTRNREHAKSTRIRKKARYQELLDCEQKLIAMEKIEILRHKRAESVVRFLSIRQRMINNGNVESIYNTSVNSLDEVVCSISNFQFETAGPPTADRRSEQAARNSSSDVNSMKDWDMSFIKQVTQCYGPGAERFVEFKVVGGADGIAMSKDGSGFSHVEIVLNVNEPRLLITATLSFQFAPGSDQIRSAAWTTLHEYCAPQELPFRASNSENLGNLLVHPSVVSLDAEKALDDDEINDNSAPGMSI
mmetsp:Transcript_41779/g.64357  ORF Transcript_41779/g.64357 Transcript_41779/m.64357 type:complete len:416 (-) Transcript_41779:125-1372(-)